MNLAECQINPIDVNFHLQKCLEIFDKNSADKILSKKNKEIKSSPLMPIRINSPQQSSRAVSLSRSAKLIKAFHFTTVLCSLNSCTTPANNLWNIIRDQLQKNNYTYIKMKIWRLLKCGWEPVCCKKQQKKVPDQLLVCGIGDL